MERGERFVFIDARSAEASSRSGSRLPGAIRMTPMEVSGEIGNVPQGQTIITYCDCESGDSSTRLALELMRRGFLNVYPLLGGLDAWREAGGVLEATPAAEPSGGSGARAATRSTGKDLR